jgi:hypothetical protein
MAMDVVPRTYERTIKELLLRRVLAAVFANYNDDGDTIDRTAPSRYLADSEGYQQIKTGRSYLA